MTTRTPVSTKPLTNADELITHLKAALDRYLANEISRSYYGDVQIYLPEHFKGARGAEKAILVFQAEEDILEEGTRTLASEYRLIRLSIIGFVNITGEFRANPTEAYGERRLTQMMSKMREFLTRAENVTLGGRVEHFSVDDLSWATLGRDKLALRGAGLEVVARVRVPRR